MLNNTTTTTPNAINKENYNIVSTSITKELDISKF